MDDTVLSSNDSSSLDNFTTDNIIDNTNYKEQMENTNWLKSWGDRTESGSIDQTMVSSTVDLSK
jgi:hypothetical protein